MPASVLYAVTSPTSAAVSTMKEFTARPPELMTADEQQQQAGGVAVGNAIPHALQQQQQHHYGSPRNPHQPPFLRSTRLPRPLLPLPRRQLRVWVCQAIFSMLPTLRPLSTDSPSNRGLFGADSQRRRPSRLIDEADCCLPEPQPARRPRLCRRSGRCHPSPLRTSRRRALCFCSTASLPSLRSLRARRSRRPCRPWRPRPTPHRPDCTRAAPPPLSRPRPRSP